MKRCYFIGGPWDLTCRMLDKAQAEYEVAEPGPIRALYTPGDARLSPVEPPTVHKRRYLLMYGSDYMQINIYIYESLVY